MFFPNVTSENESIFVEDSTNAINNKELRVSLLNNLNLINKKTNKQKSEFYNLDVLKEKAAHIKNRSIIDLPKFLIEFESNFQSHGGKVIWAQDGAEALSEIMKLARLNNISEINKTNSIVLDEINLSESLKKSGFKVNETDLNDKILENKNEKASHFTFPSIHLNNYEIDFALREIDSKKTSINTESYDKTEMCITGSQFLLADTGGVVIAENSGNQLNTVSSTKKIHIVVVGIEKVIPKQSDLHYFLSLMPVFGYGNKSNVYNTIYYGPKQTHENDGVSEMYIILLDNGRTNILEHKTQRRSLACIQCGACLNNCPVYRTIGGKPYNTTYVGPIGTIITPYMKGMKDWKHLSFASVISNSYSKACPMKINLHEQIIYNRNEAVKQGLINRNEKKIIQSYKKLMLNRPKLDKMSINKKTKVLNNIISEIWSERRAIPTFSSKTFKQSWSEKQTL